VQVTGYPAAFNVADVANSCRCGDGVADPRAHNNAVTSPRRPRDGVAARSTSYFAVGPALLGAVVHMMVGAAYGAVFGLLAALPRLRGVMLIADGAVWGAVVFAVSSFVALPVAASVFGSGDQIIQMAKMVGYGTFAIEHVIFGVTLGMMLALRRPSGGTSAN